MRFYDRIRTALALHERAETPPAGILPPSRSAAARLVTSDEAMTLPAVYRAVQIIATAVSQLSMYVERGGERLAETPGLVRNPDVMGAPRAAFLEATATSLALTGNAFWHKRRGADHAVLSLELWPATEVHVSRNPRTGAITYGRGGVDYTAADVQHLQLMRVPGRLDGLGPVQAAAADLRGGLDLRDYAATWFTDSHVPGGIVSTDQQLTPEQAKGWKAQLLESWKPGEPAVLGQGLTYDPMTLKPADAQFLESRTWTVTEVARLFGIPAKYMLAAIDGTSSTYSNQEQEDIAFVRYTLMAYLREIETAMSAVLPRGQEARFNVDALLRTDTKTRYEAHKLAIDMGLYSTAYAQQIEGLPVVDVAPRPTAPQEAPVV